ncbi:peptidoglycan endopeptidase [Erythrobacteraceae bacterium WH01K]|nr:peptidoglycan endopeptidase [Erythrobacteraceae bacterium WH01K]
MGTPFRLHGRDPASGLDCVGLVAASLARIGVRFRPPDRYALRNRSIAPLVAQMEHAPLHRLDPDTPPFATGDICLCTIGFGQHHVLIVAGPAEGRQRSFIHAHAGLRRVVLTPGDPEWPVVARWHP